MIRFSHGRGFDLTLIETMPMGDIDGDRTDQYLPLSLVRARLSERWTLNEIPYRSGGPARYVRVAETGGRISASSRRSRIISANLAIACASPALARSICASAKRMPPICARRSGRVRPTICFMPRSTRGLRASPRAMTFSLIGRKAHCRPPYVCDRRVSQASALAHWKEPNRQGSSPAHRHRLAYGESRLQNRSLLDACQAFEQPCL